MLLNQPAYASVSGVIMTILGAFMLAGCEKDFSKCQRNYQLPIELRYSLHDSLVLGDTIRVSMAYDHHFRNLVNGQTVELKNYKIEPVIYLSKYWGGEFNKLNEDSDVFTDHEVILQNVSFSETEGTNVLRIGQGRVLDFGDGPSYVAEIQIVLRKKGIYYIFWDHVKPYSFNPLMKVVEDDDCEELIQFFFENSGNAYLELLEDPDDVRLLNPEFISEHGLQIFRVDEL